MKQSDYDNVARVLSHKEQLDTIQNYVDTPVKNNYMKWHNTSLNYTLIAHYGNNSPKNHADICQHPNSSHSWEKCLFYIKHRHENFVIYSNQPTFWGYARELRETNSAISQHFIQFEQDRLASNDLLGVESSKLQTLKAQKATLDSSITTTDAQIETAKIEDKSNYAKIKETKEELLLKEAEKQKHKQAKLDILAEMTEEQKAYVFHKSIEEGSFANFISTPSSSAPTSSSEFQSSTSSNADKKDQTSFTITVKNEHIDKFNTWWAKHEAHKPSPQITRVSSSSVSFKVDSNIKKNIEDNDEILQFVELNKQQEPSTTAESLTKKTLQDFDIYENAFNQQDNSAYYYQATDISLIQKQIMQPHLADISLHEPIGNNQAITNTLLKLIDSIGDKPILCIYNIGDWHWVSFAALSKGSKKIILYKDSQGSDNPQLEAAIKKLAPDAIFKTNALQEQTTGVECGLFSLQNIQIMAEQLKASTADSFVDNFNKYEGFCSLDTAIILRKTFANKFILGKEQARIDELLKSDKLKLLRDQQKEEELSIIDKLKNKNDFTEYTIKTAQITENDTKTISVEIATSAETKPESNDYTYQYRIALSKDLAPNNEEIASAIQKVFPEIESGKAFNIARVMLINENQVTSIPKQQKSAIIKAIEPEIDDSESIVNIHTKNEPDLQQPIKSVAITKSESKSHSKSSCIDSDSISLIKNLISQCSKITPEIEIELLATLEHINDHEI